MAKELERDLGLYAVLTISIGAMVGSGIFVLPGIAATISGPAVILAYLLAGLIVLPAALSKAEMATAMPESGGTYLYIDRAMGPLMGTVSGIGAWFSLVFKSAFALVGLGAYLLLFANVAAPKLVAIVLAVVLIVVNILGVKQTGRLQAIIVTAVMAVLLVFVAGGFTSTETANYAGFFSKGFSGILAGAGFVFVSYAGVTKIASVAEEVEDPGRNIPIGMIASVLIMMAVYAAVVTVVVGVNPPGALVKKVTPVIANTAEVFFGPVGLVVLAVTAVLALTSMANAGLLASSRYPFAMSRDRLMPDGLKAVHDRFRTPVWSIALTGLTMIGLIAFVPVVELAKLASAFKIIVFSLVNLAVIALREGDLPSYEPTFTSPFYPWLQLFGIFAGLILLTQMGTLPMVGAIGLIGIGIVWYFAYAKGRAPREGAAVHALRQREGTRRVEQARQAMEEAPGYRVLVPIGEHTTEEKEALLLRLAADVVREENGGVQVIMFEEVPDQTVLPAAVDLRTPEEIEFEERSDRLAADLDVPLEIGEVVSHNAERAVVNYARSHDVDLILTDAELGDEHGLFGAGMRWLVDKAPCPVVLVKRNRGLERLDEIDVLSERGPFDPAKVRLANAIALETGASIRFLHAVEETATEQRVASLREYHLELGELCDVPTESIVLQAADRVGALVDAASAAHLVIMESHDPSLFGSDPLAGLSRRVAEDIGATTLLFHPEGAKRRGRMRGLVDRFLY